MKKALLLGGCLAAALALAGCKSTSTVYVGDHEGPPYRWVQTGNDLNDFAKVVSAKRDRQNGLLRVQVDVKNTRRSDEMIVYRFVWLDEKGIEISSIQNDWLPKNLAGYEQVQLVAIAPDTRGTDCIVKIKKSIR